MRSGRILVVALETPQPDIAAGELRLFALLQLMASRFEVHFVAMHRPKANAERYEQALHDAGVSFLGYGRRRGQAALLELPYDVVFFEFYHVAEALLSFARTIQPQSLLVVDTVDVHFGRELAAARIGEIAEGQAMQTRDLELAVYRSADLVIAVSSPDRDLLIANGIACVTLVPIVVPVQRRVERDRQHVVLFVGAFAHSPNVHGIRWFLRECWPLVRKEVPDAELVIAGRNPPPDVLEKDGIDGVRVTGFVPSMAPLLDEAQVSIAPLLYGGGMKGKVSESLANGIPVVTTSTGAQGFESHSAGAMLVADDPAPFARHIVCALKDAELRSRLTHEGYIAAEALCSVRTATEGLEPVIRRASLPTPTSGDRIGRGFRAVRWAGSWATKRLLRQLSAGK